MEGGDQGLMATIDDKVVSMSFEGSKFQSGVNEALRSIEKLKAALQFKDAGKGLIQVGNAAHHVDLGHIAQGAEGVKAKLGALNVAAVAVFAQIATKAVTAGVALAKAFTIDVAKAGFQEYSTQLNSVQTILANTQASGATLKDVNKALQELNNYSDKTIYNFGQMARNIGTFTAAGVDLKTATMSIKGIANLAALSGSNAEQASTAMYQLSQAISSGSVKLMDWNSVVNAGMGGTVFQRALALTGEHMGQLKKGTVELVGPMKNVKIAGESFRNSLSAPGKDGWLTSKVLTTTLKMFTSDMTDAELAADGWNKKEIKAIQAQAKAAMLAATNVKTIQQVLAVAKETAGSGWAKTWQIIFGDFGEAKKTFTNLSNTINGMLIDSARARNNVLADWKAMGGRTVLIDGIKTAFHNLGEVIKPIKQAFRDIFPATTGKQLYELTVRFKEFTETLKPSPQTVENLRRTFRGLFALLDIGKQIIFGLFSVFRRVFGEIASGSGGFLEFTARIGDWLVKVDKALKKGDRLNKFFDRLGSIIALPIKGLHLLADAIKSAFGEKGMAGITKGLSPVEKILQVISGLWQKLLPQLGEAGKILGPLVEAYANFFKEVGVAIVKALENMNFDAVLQVVRTGLFAGIFLMFKKFLGKGSLLDQFSKGFAGGIMGNINKSFGYFAGSMKALQGTMVGLQQNIKAKTLKEIAIAIALIAVSVLAISLVDPKKLSSSLSAITVMFGQLLGAMAILGKVTATQGFIKMPVITLALIGLAVAIDMLSIAVIALSRLSWNELLKGLTGIGVSLGILVAAVRPLSASSPGMIRAGVGLMAIATALRIMASAVKAFGEMKLRDLAQGLGAVAVSLKLMVGAIGRVPIMTKGLVAAGVSIILLAVGLRILAESVQKFGDMDMATIGKGVLAIGIALGAIGLAMRTMPKGMILQAAGLVVVAGAIQIIANAISSLGGKSVGTLAKGLITLTLALMILQSAMVAMETLLPGAEALVIVAGGVFLLANALQTMGNMSWMEIGKAMIALAAAFTIIGVAAALITPAIPSLLAFGVAIALIGIGLAATGAALFLIAAGLSALIVAAPTGFGVLLAAIVEFQQGIIKTAKLLVLGVLEIVKSFAEIAPQFVDSLVKIIDSILDAVMQIIPKLVPLIDIIITALVKALDNNQDRIIKAAFDLVIALLQGLRNSIGEIARLAVEIVAELVRGIANNISKIVSAGVRLITAFLRGIANGYAGITRAAISIITKFLGAIASNIGRIATAGLNIVTKLLGAIARSLGRVIKAGTDVIVAFINGVGSAGPRIITAATNAIIKFINALSKNGVKLADAGAQAIIYFLNGIAKVIEKREPEIMQAGFRIGVAVIRGFINGLGSLAHELANKVKSLGTSAINGLRKATHTDSPSKDAHKVGQAIVQGLANGMTDNGKAVDASVKMGVDLINAVEDTLEIASPSKVFVEIGRNITAGLAKGIKEGSEEDLRQAFQDLNTKFSDAMNLFHSRIATERAKIKEEKDKKKKDRNQGVINAANVAIDHQNKLIDRATKAHKEFNKHLKVQRGQLIANAQAHAALAQKIDDEKQKLQDLQQTLDDATQSYKDQYGELPDVTPEDPKTGLQSTDPVGVYTEALKTQIAATTKYAETLQALRGLGLDDETYKKLLAEGPEAQAFATQLLSGGKTAVQSLGVLSGQLKTESGKLATQAATNLYQAGVDAQAGLVKGLESDMTALIKAAEKIATTIVAAIKRKLKIKSPSEVFAEIGKFSMEGMAAGFSDTTVLTDAVDAAGQDAIDAMRKSISEAAINELDVNPTITPILDLTQVKSKAAELAALTAAGSYGQASAISSAQTKTEAEQIAATGGATVKFEQNNYSPEALSDIEIYRQTKNQLSQLKSSLALT
jgi:tape measure domain-containing protein